MFHCTRNAVISPREIQGIHGGEFHFDDTELNCSCFIEVEKRKRQLAP